jgi:hypothetical protein
MWDMFFMVLAQVPCNSIMGSGFLRSMLPLSYTFSFPSSCHGIAALFRPLISHWPIWTPSSFLLPRPWLATPILCDLFLSLYCVTSHLSSLSDLYSEDGGNILRVTLFSLPFKQYFILTSSVICSEWLKAFWTVIIFLAFNWIRGNGLLQVLTEGWRCGPWMLLSLHLPF